MEYKISNSDELNEEFIEKLKYEDIVIIDFEIDETGLFAIKLDFIMQVCKVQADGYTIYYTKNNLVHIQNIEKDGMKICRFKELPGKTFAKNTNESKNYLLPIGSIITDINSDKYLITGRIGTLEIGDETFYVDYFVEDYPVGYTGVTTTKYLNTEAIKKVNFIGLQDDIQDSLQLEINEWLENTELKKYTEL